MATSSQGLPQGGMASRLHPPSLPADPRLSIKRKTYRMTQCRATEMNMATSSQGLLQGGMTSRLESSLRALSALSISMTTITVSASVHALVLPTC